MAELGEVKRKIAEFEAKDETEKAIKELEKAIKEFPKEGSLLNKLGDLYLKAKRQKDALNTYEKGARIFKEETYYPNAIALCKKILRFDKERTEVYGLLGELHKELDQRGEAANYLLEYADRKIKQKDLETALKSYNTIMQLIPNNPKILQTIAAIYEQMGKKDQAAEIIKEARQIESEQGKLKETIAIKEPAPIKEVVAPKEKVVEKPPEKPVEKAVERPKEKIVEKPKEAEKPKAPVPEEIEEVKEVARERPKEVPKEIPEELVSPELAEMLQDKTTETPEPEGEEEVREGGVEEEKPATQLSEIERTIELGELYCSLGSEDEAVDCFRNAANESLDNDDHDTALALNRRIADLRPFDLKSRQYLIEIAKIKGDKDLQIKSMLDLAEALSRREAKTEALSLYKKILELDPDNVVANEMFAAVDQSKDFIDLGEVLRTELEHEEKVRGVQTISELISEFRREIFECIGEGDYRSHYDLGVAYKGMGLFQEAIEEFEIAGKDENLKLKSIEMIGSCLIEYNKFDEAIKVLNGGLHVANRPLQEYFGIHFLIGKAYEKESNLTQALKSYISAYNIDKTVPDLIKKINELKDQLTKELSKRGRRRVEKRTISQPEYPKVAPKKSKITYL